MGVRSKPAEAEVSNVLIPPDLLHACWDFFSAVQQRVLRAAAGRAASLRSSRRVIMSSEDIVHAARQLYPSIVPDLKRDLQKAEPAYDRAAS